MKIKDIKINCLYYTVHGFQYVKSFDNGYVNLIGKNSTSKMPISYFATSVIKEKSKLCLYFFKLIYVSKKNDIDYNFKINEKQTNKNKINFFY